MATRKSTKTKTPAAPEYLYIAISATRGVGLSDTSAKSAAEDLDAAVGERPKAVLKVPLSILAEKEEDLPIFSVDDVSDNNQAW